MKRFLFISLCLLGGWFSSQAQYRVYSYEGNVQYKQSGSSSQWKAVEVDLVLNAIDSLSVAKNGSVRVEDTRQNKIYKVSGKEKDAVYELVRDAKNNLAARILGGLNISLRSGERDTMKNSVHAMKIIGAGSRGSAAEREVNEIDYDQLAEQLAWIGAQACSGKKSPKIDGITLKRHKLSGGELDFEFENRTDIDYHINVLHVNKRTHSVSLCYVITPEIEANACPITPSGFCSCAMDVYFPDGADDVYVLVALKEPYDSYALDNELLYHRTDKAQKTQTDIQYMW